MNFRSCQRENDSDSDYSSSSADSDSTGKKSSTSKRRRALAPSSPVDQNTRRIPDYSQQSISDSPMNLDSAPRQVRKTNAIWADVITEQHLTQTISGSVCVQGPKQKIRGPETYNYKNAALLNESNEKESIVIDKHLNQNINAPKKDSDESIDFDNGGVHLNDKQERDNVAEVTHSNASVGKKRPRYKHHGLKQFCPMKYGVKFDADEELDPVSLAEKLSNALNEQKADLITRCLRTLGLAKCVSLYEETEKIERAGGILTLDNQRRRSPGGIFLYCLKNDPQINDEQKNRIFGESKREERVIAKVKRRAKPLIPQSFKDSLEDLRSVLDKKRNPSTEKEEGKLDEKIWKNKKDVFLEDDLTAKNNRQINEEPEDRLSGALDCDLESDG